MASMSEIYGTQLDDVLEAYTDAVENKPVTGCEIIDIMQEYYHLLGLKMSVSGVVTAVQKSEEPWKILIRIKLDGYQVEFVHDPTFEIPPPKCWHKIGGGIDTEGPEIPVVSGKDGRKWRFHEI